MRQWGVCLMILLVGIPPASALAREGLRIGVPMGFPPFAYQDEGESEVRGYSVDVLNILCRNLSLTPRFLVGNQADLVRALKDGDLDLVIGIVMNDPQRQQFNTLEILIYVKRYVFVHHPIDQTADASGAASVVVSGQPYMTSGSAERGHNTIQARSIKEALMMVDTGQAQRFIDYSDQLATYLIGKHGLEHVRQAGVQMGRFPFIMIIDRNNAPLSSGLRQALGRAIKSGQLDQVRDKWLGRSYASYIWQRFAPLCVLVASTIASMVVFFFAWHMALKRKVLQVTRRLRTSEARYRQLIESAPDMVFLVDQIGWIQLANHSASERLLIPPDQLLLSKLHSLIVPEERERFQGFWAHLFSHQMATLETRLTNLSSREINVELVAARLRRSNEEQDLACCFARDLTTRKLIEQELIASERLATIGKIAAGVAHEVNNPIGIILAHAEDLISGELDDEEAQDSLKAIRRNALRAGNITRALLDQATAAPVERVALDVVLVLEECLHFLKPRLKKAVLIRDMQPNVHWVLGDDNQLQQVFINLLLNARDAIEAQWGDRPADDAGPDKTICLWTGTEGAMVVCRVCDTGTGIPDNQAEKIFEPFFTTKDVGKGTGLGLSISYGIVKECGGSIEAIPNPPHGTCFVLRFPMLDESPGKTPDEARETESADG